MKKVIFATPHALPPISAIIAPVPTLAATPPEPISRRYDALFASKGRKLPVPFLRALAKKESNMNPRESGGSYWGLLQVGYKNVLPGYNERYNTTFTPQDLLNSEINVPIAAEMLTRIITSYRRNHPQSPNLQENWANPEFVKLLLAGWNSGYSEASGVGRVARYLESRNLPVTHDNVFEYAQSAGATRHLSNLAKRTWQRTTAALFYEQPDALQALREPVVSMMFPFWLPSNWGVFGNPGFGAEPFPGLQFGRPARGHLEVVSGWGAARGARPPPAHQGIDIPMPEGTGITAVADGVVYAAKMSPDPTGLWIGLQHSAGWATRSMHLSKNLVQVGQIVHKGQLIGLAGATGGVKTPHLHFSLLLDKGRLPAFIVAYGRPTQGFGKERSHGVGVPAEPVIPVDSYSNDVIEAAARRNVMLYQPLLAKRPPRFAAPVLASLSLAGFLILGLIAATRRYE